MSVANFIKEVMKAPDSQIDSTIIPKLQDVLDTPIKERPDKIKNILDECAYASQVKSA